MNRWKSIAEVMLCSIFLLIVVGCESENRQEFSEARQSFLKAIEASERGDSAKAIDAFTRSIDVLPSTEAYLERARLYALAQQKQEALRDCQAALDLDPENDDARWLLEEIEKPADQRFLGKNKNPPSSSGK